ncbi:MAG: protease Lon-related BREX system protein BrxL [Lachnospiraceae bacterium]|nr:protease Lon-related BREX system protein BrxL [Lachnospiraceae bacterium]
MIDEFSELDDNRTVIKTKLRHYFDGRIVRKDLTKRIKEGANVPVYVLEFLLGQYCSSDDEEIIEEGVNNVKRILADNFVRPDEAQKVLSILRERGSYTVIDKITVHLNFKEDRYEAEFSNLGIKDIPIKPEYPSKYDRLLCGGIWCILQLDYEFVEEDKKNVSPIRIRKLTPIQMPHIDMDELKNGRKAFTKEEWIDVLLRSTGMEPDKLSDRVKWLLLARMIPLVENNFNLCELGPRSTGKSHIYKEISPNSILVSGGQTTVANLFYNMSTKTVGLVGMWDCVAFDEVAGITFKDKDGVQIMKDYMASGSFSRGREEKAASASMAFVGNINQSVEVLMKTSHLFEPFPDAMAYDTAFLDRMHCYIPGWEIPKYRPEHFTDDYGFITDYLSEFMRQMRKENYGDAADKYFRFGNNLNQRDTIAVRKMVSGFVKLVYPDGEVTKEELAEILDISMEMRRRVKEQLKKIGGMEFYDVNFSYIDNDTFEEKYVTVPEHGGGKLIPEGMNKPGHVYTVSQCKTGMVGVYRLETQVLPGNGKFERNGIGSDRDAREATNTAFNYLKANGNSISGSISTTTKDYIIHYQDLQGIGMTKDLALASLIALCSAALGKPTLSSLAVLGEISISGTLIKVNELANVLQVCLDSGAKKVLLPITSAGDLGSVPSDLVGAFSLIFYSSPQEAVFKALGVE